MNECVGRVERKEIREIYGGFEQMFNRFIDSAIFEMNIINVLQDNKYQ